LVCCYAKGKSSLTVSGVPFYYPTLQGGSIFHANLSQAPSILPKAGLLTHPFYGMFYVLIL
jgi:hypothetical protein